MVVSVRSSKYRHVFGDPTRKDKCFDNIRLTKNAFDANLAKSNGKFVSLNWEASGGGSFAVLPIKELGKLPDRFPLFDGHKGPVLDTDWNPFDDTMVVSASDDGSIGVWRVPEDFSVHVDYGNLDNCEDIAPVKFLEGHGKKVGHVHFNPVAKDILASASLDNTIKVWNLETGEVLYTLKHPSFVTSFAWNYDGTKIASVAKDKQLRIWDVRAEKVISEGKGHAGAKGSRVVWLGDNDRVLTTGFSLVSDREMAIWDTTDISKGPIGGFRGLDPSSGIVIPHYDPMTSMVYLGGRGDGKIVYFEYADDTLYDLFAYNSTSPQRGLGWIPNLRLDPRNHEVARAYKVHETLVEPISFKVPLKNEGFLDNVYTFVEVDEPALTADEWKSGKTSRPLVRNWKDLYDEKESKAFESPKSEKRASSSPSKTATPEASAKEAKSPKEAAASSNTEKAPKKEAPESVPSTKASASEEKIAALKKAEKQDSYDVLQSKEVKNFLAKNSEKDNEVEAENDEDSTWGDDSTSARDLKSQQSQKKEEPKKEAAKEESKKGEIKNEEPKKEAAKKEEPKKETAKKEEPKKEEPKKEPKKEEPKKEEPKKEEPKKEEPKKEEPKKAEANKESAKKDEPKKDLSKKEESKKESAKKEEPKKELFKKELPKTAENGESKKEADAVKSDDNDKLNLILEKLDNLSARLSKLEAKAN